MKGNWLILVQELLANQTLRSQVLQLPVCDIPGAPGDTTLLVSADQLELLNIAQGRAILLEVLGDRCSATVPTLTQEAQGTALAIHVHGGDRRTTTGMHTGHSDSTSGGLAGNGPALRICMTTDSCEALDPDDHALMLKPTDRGLPTLPGRAAWVKHG